MGFLILFVTHEMASAASVCDEIVVIKGGRVVEAGRAQDILRTPKEPYTKELIEANFANRNFRK